MSIQGTDFFTHNHLNAQIGTAEGIFFGAQRRPSMVSVIIGNDLNPTPQRRIKLHLTRRV